MLAEELVGKPESGVKEHMHCQTQPWETTLVFCKSSKDPFQLFCFETTSPHVALAGLEVSMQTQLA